MKRMMSWLVVGLMAAALVAVPDSALAASAAGSGGSAAVSAQATVPLSKLRLTLSKRFSGLSEPLYFTSAKGNAGRSFVVEKGGRIRIVRAGGRVVSRPYLDISTKVSKGGEQGLLGMALAPDFMNNGRFYVNYTDLSGSTVIARYTANDPATDAPTLTDTTILTRSQPYANHNGGCLQFGPDNMLYIGMGDGGGAGDPKGNAQKKNTRLGKMLRIDVGETRAATALPATYRIPKDNPFVGNSAYAQSIWALGLRNPWRFSFDSKTGAMWIGDVGQERREEIDYLGKGVKGVNFGWDRYEGLLTYPPGSPAPSNASSFRKPVKTHKHPTTESITGGYVYRGTDYPVLQGVYVYADFITGRIYFLRKGTPVRDREMRNTSMNISSFGLTAGGELYLCDMKGGAIYKVGAKRVP